MSEEMIACPFCGSEQVTTSPCQNVTDDDRPEVTWAAICKACAARVDRDTETTAIAAWNTRPNERLREALERVAELEAALEAAKPRYAQPCFDHEYITPGCPDCGRLA